MKIQAVRGMQDLLPEKKAIFRLIDEAARSVFQSYGYKEIGLPIIEETGLFERLVGRATDIVEKEMYTFQDRNGESITLRPEGTAGCARFAEQNGLLFNQIQRFWYQGPMFRYERPQRGRYRQFEQLGAECFGIPTPDIDAEIILLNARIFRLLGLDGDITLELNSLGNSESRESFKYDLVEYLTKYKSDLDIDSQRRLIANPLRILDSKDPTTQSIMLEAPKLLDYLDSESKAHFESLKTMLGECGLDFVLNPNIVRGLDYYNKTVFEWTTKLLGAQATVSGGGRYDNLVNQLGGRDTPGIGFAVGLDRLALLLEQKSYEVKKPDIYFVSPELKYRSLVLCIAEKLKDQIPSLSIIVHCGESKMKAQMKKADSSGARMALILGEDESSEGKISIKLLRETSEQVTILQSEVAEYCSKYFCKEDAFG